MVTPSCVLIVSRVSTLLRVPTWLSLPSALVVTMLGTLLSDVSCWWRPAVLLALDFREVNVLVRLVNEPAFDPPPTLMDADCDLFLPMLKVLLLLGGGDGDVSDERRSRLLFELAAFVSFAKKLGAIQRIIWDLVMKSDLRHGLA
jgi:hypothetical protein